MREHYISEGLIEFLQATAPSWATKLTLERISFASRLAESTREVTRLRAVLERIEGGDQPCREESLLRQWAYEALTLGRDVDGLTQRRTDGKQDA